ncbi:MAG: TonB-dependent receptor [Steroidobacteraceae bacterium]
MSSSFCAALTLSTLIATGTAAAADADTTPTGSIAGPQAEGLTEVVVTARRFTENLQDVPLAVTAISASTLLAQDVTNLQDLNSFVPNMKIAADRATSSTINIYIRGVGQSDPLWGFDPGVGVYVDDVYLARPQAALLDVIDVQQIEVLRGPQGTLYGKNTIAGALKYTTRDIDGPATLTASVTGGNYGEHDERVNFSTPVIEDHVYFGVALADLQHYGYGEVVAQPGYPPSTYNYLGESVSNKDVLAGRVNLTIKWGESSKLKITADDILDNSNASGGQRLNDVYAPELGNPFDTRTDMPVDNDYSHRNGASAIYTQSLTDQLSLKIVGAYIHGRSQQFIDFEELDENLFQVPGEYHDQQSSGEGQLIFTNDLVKAVGGVFYMASTACGAYNASIGVLAAPDDLYLTSIVTGCQQTTSEAVFADSAWKLTDRLNLDAGVRWNDDDKTASVYQAQYASLAPTQLLAGQQFFNPQVVPAGFFLFPNAATGVVTDYTNSRSFVNFSPRLSLDYHWTPQVMTYASWSRGFKSGGFDMRGNELLYPQTRAGYNPETANNYEIGIKSTMLDDTLLMNFTVFYDPYTNAQIGVQQFVDVGGVPENVTAVLNAGKQINQGVELESVYKPIKALTLALNLGYLDSYYEDYLIGCTAFTPGCTPGSPPVNVADQNRPINAPTWTASGNAVYTWDLFSGSILARIGYDWRSFTKVANTTPSVTDQPAYGLLNAGVAYTTSNNAWRFSIDGKNLTDRYYRVAGYDFGGPGTGLLASVSQIGFYGPPRTVSATVAYHF